MDENLISPFVLNNRLAAISTAITEDRIFATDGIEPYVHIFDFNGNFLENTETIRNYRRLRSNPYCNGYTALDVDCTNSRLYILNDAFREVGYIDLDTNFSGSGCGCNCGNAVFRRSSFNMVDASLTRIGSETFVVGVFTKNAYLFDLSGKRLTRLSHAEDCEDFTDYISTENDIVALGMERCSVTTLKITSNDTANTTILNSGCTLRMIFEWNGDIYGLFGQSYIYNRIIKIYGDGRFYQPCPYQHNSICGA